MVLAENELCDARTKLEQIKKSEQLFLVSSSTSLQKCTKICQKILRSPSNRHTDIRKILTEKNRHKYVTIYYDKHKRTHNYIRHHNILQTKINKCCVFRFCLTDLLLRPAHVAQWSKHSGAMCSRVRCTQKSSNLSPSEFAYQRIISNNSYAHDKNGGNPGQKKRVQQYLYKQYWHGISSIKVDSHASVSWSK